MLAKIHSADGYGKDLRQYCIVQFLGFCLVLNLSAKVPAFAEDNSVDESILRARDDLQYQVDTLEKNSIALSRTVSVGRKKLQTHTYVMADRKKARAGVVSAISELQRRLQFIDESAKLELNDNYNHKLEQTELESRLQAVDQRLTQARKSLAEVNRMIDKAM